MASSTSALYGICSCFSLIWQIYYIWQNRQVIYDTLLSIYPNPFLETFNIEINANTLPNPHTNITDLMGRSIVRKNFENVDLAGQNVTITLGKEIPPGPYIISITTQNRSFNTIIIKG
jgi:hypothetical protein